MSTTVPTFAPASRARRTPVAELAFGQLAPTFAPPRKARRGAASTARRVARSLATAGRAESAGRKADALAALARAGSLLRPPVALEPARRSDPVCTVTRAGRGDPQPNGPPSVDFA